MEPLYCRLLGDPEELSAYGDYSAFLYRFAALPQSKRGKPDEARSVFAFFVQLEVSGRLPHLEHWQSLGQEDCMKLYFAFVREKLRESPPQKRRGKGEEAETLLINLTPREGFNPASYAPQSIDPKKVWLLAPKIGQLGLSKV